MKQATTPLQARKLEGELDTKVAAYGKLCSAYEYGYSAGESGLSSDQALNQRSVEIESLINRLRSINDEIASLSGESGSSESRAHMLARHRDILQDFTHEFKRLSSIANATRDRADLLGTGRTMSPGGNGMTSTTGLLLRERGALDRSGSAIDTVVAQAYGVASHLTQQRQLFDSIDSKLTTIGAKFPVVNSVLNAIRRKKNRDNVILASVMAACILMILIYWIRK